MRILLLEENSTEAELIISVLKRSGLEFKWRLASDKMSFSLALEVFQPQVVLAGSSLLHFSAMDALKLLRGQAPHIAFILTNTVSEEFAREMIKLGADNYIIKDKLSRLPAAIEAVIRQKQTEKEKLEAGQKLVQSEERFRALVERISDGFIALDKDWRYIYVNRKIGEMVHRDPQSLVGKKIWDEFPAAVGTPTYNAFMEAMREQRYISNVDHYEPLGLWQENHIYPSPDGLSVFIRDITEAKRTAKEVQTLKDRLFFHIEHSPLAFIELDEKLKVRSWPLRAQEIFGWTEREIIAAGKTDFSGGAIESLQKVVLQMIPGEVRSLSSRHRNHTKNGSVIWCEWSSSISKNKNGLTTVMCLVQDVSERKKAEEDLRLSEMRLKEAQDLTNLSHWEIDLITNTHTWSDEMFRILGLNKEIVPSRGLILSIIYPGDLEYIREKLFDNYYYQHYSGLNFRFIRSDGAVRHAYTQWNVEYDEQSNPRRLYGVFQDVTEQKEAEIELQNTNEELRTLSAHLQNVREEERIHIAREIHDELGQQLTGLKMSISLLHRKLPGEEEIKKKLAEVIEQIDETVKSVRRISTSLRPSILDDLGLIAALEWHSKEVEKRSEITVNFTAEMQEPELTVPAATGIFRIYQEILTNAVRHANAHEINASLSLNAGFLLLRVQDDGRGMDPSATKTKKTLGLLGIKERTFLLGGRFDLESQPGCGTAISIWIPVPAEP